MMLPVSAHDAGNLDAETLGNRVAAKVSRAAGFSVCHSFRYYAFITQQ